MARRSVVQVPPGVDVRELPPVLRVGVPFRVRDRDYVCEEAGTDGLRVAEAAGASTASPEEPARLVVVRQCFL